MIYVILGMHKSGTTLIAQMLHESGINMGEFNPDLGYDEDNKYERHSAQELNRSLLDGYLVPPFKVWLRLKGGVLIDQAGYRKNSDSLALVRHAALKRKLEAVRDQRFEELINNCNQDYTDWGFKDPRTCLTYPVWRQYLPEHRLIIVYRSYIQLAHRYLKGSRNLPRMFRVLHSWTTYNMAILENLENSSVPALILNYERMMAGNGEFQRLTAFMERPISDSRDPNLYRNRSREENQLSGMIKLWLPFLPAQPQAVLQSLETKREESIEVKAESSVEYVKNETE